MHDFFAIIISYNPDVERLMGNYKSLIGQGFKVLIIDNGSRENLGKHFSDNELIQLGDNKGIATALNIGMKRAKVLGGKWVLSLDQDTEVASNLLEEYRKHINLYDVGALSPRIIRRGEEERKNARDIEEIERCPTSGFFLPIEVWDKVGGYDDWMFIDYVDYDICKRIMLEGYHIYRINKTYIIQELGQYKVNRFFDALGKKLRIQKLRNFAKTYNHSPMRNYYFVRNALYYMEKYKDSIDLKYEKGFLRRWELKKLILEKNRIQNIRQIIRGVKDFNRKKRQLNNAG